MFGSRKREGVTLESVYHHTLMRTLDDGGGEFQDEASGSVAVLEPEPEPQPVVAPVMERAKAVIAPIDNGTDIEVLNYEVARLTRERSALFGVEHEARIALEGNLTSKRRELRKARAFQNLPIPARRVDLEVLTWRKPEVMHVGKIGIPQPELALFHLDQNWIRLDARWANHGSWEPALPHHITKLYEDVYVPLSSTGSAYERYSLHASFTGVIPLETKEKIREAQRSKIYDEIRLLAEAEWTLQSSPGFYADPIVVGLLEDELWVIDIFDPTPLEDYIAKEFTT